MAHFTDGWQTVEDGKIARNHYSQYALSEEGDELLQDFQILPTEWDKKTKQPARYDAFVLFATKRDLKRLSRRKHWFTDGTFQCVPELFDQMVTVHTNEYGVTMPAAYGLLTGKSEILYNAFFSAIKGKLTNTPAVEKITCDFELALVNALDNVFEVQVKGCLFHYCQALLRWVRNKGYRAQYEEEGKFHKYVRRYMALPLLLLEDIPRAIDKLERRAPSSLDAFIAYWSEQWGVGSPCPPERWCVHGETQRTNNCVEGWHNRVSVFFFQLLLTSLHS